MKDILFPSFIITMLLLFGISNTLYAIPLFFALIALFGFFLNHNLLIRLYLMLLPLNNVIPKEYYLFKVIGIDTVTNILIIVYLIQVHRSTIKKNINELSKLIQSLILAILTYYIYVAFKDYYFGLGEIGLLNTIMRTFNLLLIFVPIILLVRIQNTGKFIKTIERGLYQGAILLGVMSLLTAVFMNLGFYTSMVVNRINGFMGGGNTNTLGGFFVLCIAYYLLKYKNGFFDKRGIYLIILSLIVIADTVSRSAFIGLLSVIGLYLIKSKLNKRYIRILSIIIFAGVITFTSQKMIFERMSVMKNEQFTTIEGSGTRIGKWIIYLSDIKRNPMTLVHGSDHILYLSKERRAAHNFFIQVMFESGLIFSFWILIVFFKLFVKRNKYGFEMLYFLLPIFAILLANSEMGVLWYFFFYPGLLAYIIKLKFGKDKLIIANNVRYSR